MYRFEREAFYFQTITVSLSVGFRSLVLVFSIFMIMGFDLVEDLRSRPFSSIRFQEKK